MSVGFMAPKPQPDPEPCRHRGDWDRSVINGIVLLMCGECAFTKVLAEDLETGRLYWEEVPDEGDARLGGSDVAEAVSEVPDDQGEQRVHHESIHTRRSRKLVQVVHGSEGEGAACEEEGQSSPTTGENDYEVLPPVQTREIAE